MITFSIIDLIDQIYLKSKNEENMKSGKVFSTVVF